MNKSDWRLILFLLFIVLFAFILFHFFKKGHPNQALVYYENDIILKIPLQEEKQYTVKGANGDVTIETKNGKIRVVEENSPHHLCSTQGFIANTYETIICLPNKITIRIDSNGDHDIDATVK